MTGLGHENQEADSIRRTNIAMSLLKDLYPIANDVPIPSEWLFGDNINARSNNIKAQQKAFKVDKTHFKPERTFDRLVYFSKQIKKTGTRKSIQGTQRQTFQIESKELEEKVSIRKHNEYSLIVPTDVLYTQMLKTLNEEN